MSREPGPSPGYLGNKLPFSNWLPIIAGALMGAALRPIRCHYPRNGSWTGCSVRHIWCLARHNDEE